MKKPTDEELGAEYARLVDEALQMQYQSDWDAKPIRTSISKEQVHIGRALYYMGHADGKTEGKSEGWRECIEALRVHMTEDGSGVIFDADDAADYLERLAKERGHGL